MWCHVKYSVGAADWCLVLCGYGIVRSSAVVVRQCGVKCSNVQMIKALLFSVISFGLLMALSMGVAVLIWLMSKIVNRGTA